MSSLSRTCLEHVEIPVNAEQAAATAKGAAASAKLMAERATQRGAQKAKGEE